jgi:hypothetical protein
MRWLTRKDLRRRPDIIFLFRDNLEQRGFGGQAKAMRGEPNAIGIPTDKKPTGRGNMTNSREEIQATV